MRNYDFPLDANPWFEPFPESIQIKSLIGEVKGIDFIGIKVGDVNQSASLINVESSELLTRNAAPELAMTTNAAVFHPGEMIAVPIFVNPDRVAGLQFGLRFNDADLQLLEVLPGMISSAEMNTQMQDRGILTFSWVNQEQFAFDEQAPYLFTMRFLAQRQGRLESSLALNDQMTISEYYTEQLVHGSLALSFTEVSVPTDQLRLYPNPAKSVTHLQARMEKSSQIEVFIRNVNGQQLRLMQFEVSPGIQQLPISLDGIPAGVLWFDIKGETWQQSIKVVHQP